MAFKLHIGLFFKEIMDYFSSEMERVTAEEINDGFQ